MKKFKDFLYNYNDIVLAIVILLLALGVIAWRTQVIMDYPKTLTATQEEQKQDNSQSQDQEQTSQSDQNKTQDGQSQQDELWKDGKLTKAITVEIKAGSTAEEAVNPLIAARLFTDYQEFAKVCQSAKVNPESIRADKFSFTIGMTKEDIAKKVTQ